MSPQVQNAWFQNVMMLHCGPAGHVTSHVLHNRAAEDTGAMRGTMVCSQCPLLGALVQCCEIGLQSRRGLTPDLRHSFSTEGKMLAVWSALVVET